MSVSASGDYFWVKDEEHSVTVVNEEEAIAQLNKGKRSRKVGDNGINKESSRSHSIFVLTINQKS